MAPNQDPDYLAAGFNDFLIRPLVNVVSGSTPPPVRQVNFDQSQITGSLGDIFTVGKILLNGVIGTISTTDENGNKTHIAAYHHCHFHFIPRYVTGHVVHRYGIDFVDKQWGKPLNIDPSLIDVVKPSTDFIDSLVKELRDAIQETMKDQ